MEGVGRGTTPSVNGLEKTHQKITRVGISRVIFFLPLPNPSFGTRLPIGLRAFHVNLFSVSVLNSQVSLDGTPRWTQTSSMLEHRKIMLSLSNF